MQRRVGLTTPLLRVGMWSLLAGTYSCITLLISHSSFAFVHDLSLGLDAILTFAMALLIAFRTNRAYERWWEARAQWGKLVNVSRNLAVKVRELHEPNEADCQHVRNVIVAFAMGLRDHLRDKPVLKNLPGLENSNAVPGHMPSYIVRRLYRQFRQWQAAGKLTDEQLWVLDRETRELLEVCGSCERIKNTLMSISWQAFTRQCIAIYLFVLPWGMVDAYGVWTIPLTAVVAYFVIAGEGIAHYVEEPFGIEEDHLDLDRIVLGIDRSVSEVLLADD